MNKDLYNKEFPIPDDMKIHLKKNMERVKSVAKDTEGYRRNMELQAQKTISYPQLKRIKNFFDSFKGKTNDIEYILNGGSEMNAWVNTTLNSVRENLKSLKTNKKEAGFSNQFRREHTKPGINVRPSKEHLKTTQKYATSIGNLPNPVMEEINKIKDIINKLI